MTPAVKELVEAAEVARLVIRRLAGGEIDASRRLGAAVEAVKAEEKAATEHKFYNNHGEDHCLVWMKAQHVCGQPASAAIHQIGGKP